MFSGGVGAEPRLQRILTLFDMETAAMVCILLGIVQVLLSAPLYYTDVSVPKHLFFLPLLIGTLVVMAGCVTMASVRSPSRYLRQSCAYSNVAGLLGAVLALCVYCLSLRSVEEVECAEEPKQNIYDSFYVEHCVEERIMELFWCLTSLLLCYNVGTLLLHGLLTVTSIRALRSP